ncbi:MAG: hypothetical protein R6V01_08710 [Thermoplasmatota archaeon]
MEADPMELLRNKSRLTKLQILLEIVLNDPGDQRTISSAIEITPQAVSEYLRKMEQEDLVDLSRKAPRATVKGVELLQSSLLRLKEFVDDNISKLSIIRSIDAIAFEDLCKGDDVGLFMKAGLLMAAASRESPSTGKAEHDADEGDMVSISDLSGVLELPPLCLFLLEITPARQGGSRDRIDPEKLGTRLSSISDKKGLGERPRAAVMDLEAAGLMLRSGLRYDLEMPGTDTIMDHLERGVSLLLIGTTHSLAGALKRISMASMDIETVNLDLNDLK